VAYLNFWTIAAGSLHRSTRDGTRHNVEISDQSSTVSRHKNNGGHFRGGRAVSADGTSRDLVAPICALAATQYKEQVVQACATNAANKGS
jgi:hypothetical protein